ncbi:MAG: glycoside-pentoside-hexuronide (GPH):cation symporter [Brooklawnia sp.]|uniref:MFS transporter n=1 Tax=Brooklawnia sp. TaxID=2699740 RepID=UPI003C729FB5
MSKSVTDPVAQEPGTAKRPFGMRDKIGYMFGDFGNDFTFILQMMFFMLFYTNVVGIQPGHVGLLFLVARVVDGFTDVGLGIIVDRLPVKKQGEKFKRWIKYIAIPVAVASALMYMSFVADWESYTARVAWMTATYFLWGSVCYTAINIPYGSMASVISADPDDRAQLSVFRSTGANLAMLIISSLLPLIVYTRNAEGVAILDGQRMTIAAVVCSVLAVVCYAFCYFNVEERVIAPAKPRGEGGAGIGKMLASITTNRALLTLILAALLLLLGNLFLSGMLGYVFLTYFGNGQLQAGASLAALLPTFALIVVAPFLGKRYGKAETGAVAMIIAGVVFIGAYFLQTENAVLWIVLYAIGSFCIAVFNFLVWAFITDVIDYQDVRTGQRDDATVYALYSWSRKVGQALAGGLTGAALGWIGFSAEAAKAGQQQPQEVVDGIYLLVNVIPGVCFILVGLTLLFLYPLKKNAVARNVEILAARRTGSMAENDPLLNK